MRSRPTRSATTPLPGVLLSALAALLLGACDPGPGAERPQAGREEAVQAPSAEPRPERPAGHQRMLAALREIADRAPDEHPWMGTLKARRLRERLANLPDDVGDVRRWRVHFRLGMAELELGNEAAALEQLEAAYELLTFVGDAIGDTQREQTILNLGVAHMRWGETQNCCLRNSSESCILPFTGAALHTVEDGSRNAIGYFKQLLDPETTSPVTRLTALWLYNLAYMTLGEYPDKVPPEHRLPEGAFAVGDEVPRFENVMPELGLDTFNLAGGVIVDDFDGDDDLDIMTCTWDPEGSTLFLRNDGEDGFTDATQAAGLEGLYGGLNMVQADYDNDGDVDVFILRGSWLGSVGRHPNSLLRNEGDGSFTDVTFDAGLAEPAFPTKTAAWADYDGDGDLDLYVGNESSGPDDDVGFYVGSQDLGDIQAPSQLFRNEGDGTFLDVALEAGLAEARFVMGATWGDYDGDGDPDLYVSAVGPNRLFRNEGNGTFVDVAEEAQVREPLGSFPTWWWDFDNDGALDLYSSASSGPVALLALFPLGVDVPAGDPAERDLQNWARTWLQMPSLYQGDGRGGFEEVAGKLGLVRPTLPMGANFGDLDGDGLLDFYLATGSFMYSELRPNVMYLQRPEGGFVDVTMAGGFGHVQKGHGVAFADLDADGDQDVYAQMGGAAPGDKFSDALFLNPGFGNHHVTLRLVGHTSNRSAIGARIHVRVRAGETTRSIYRHVNSGASFGASPLRQHIGLGLAESIESVEVHWPTSGTTQTFSDLELDRAYRIDEGSEEATPFVVPPTRLGGR